MKKICLYILSIICLIFLFPVILTSRFSSLETAGIQTTKNDENKVENQNESPYDYKKYGTINLINSQTNETTQIGLDEYLLRSSFCRNAGKL